MDDFREQARPIIRRALEEDLGLGDVTTMATVDDDIDHKGTFLVKADGVVSGLHLVAMVFDELDYRIQFHAHVRDGEPVKKGDIIATAQGPGRGLLSGERTALNILQRMSGIATATHRYVERIEGSGARILDTRKTAPGLRLLDKRAVCDGGGLNHRFGLYDMVMIKDNHIVAAGGIQEAVERVRKYDHNRLPIEVEVKNLAELEEALTLDLDRIMLDNMSIDEMTRAVDRTGGRVPLEASGNVSLERIAEIAATGVDFISVGALTHTVTALDISFNLERTPESKG